jgi:hypothetical protein
MSDLRDAERQLIGDIWTSDEPYLNLLHLCDDIGSRWAGSPSEHAAGEFIQSKLVAYGLQNVVVTFCHVFLFRCGISVLQYQHC